MFTEYWSFFTPNQCWTATTWFGFMARKTMGLVLRQKIKPTNAPAVVTLGDARFFIESVLTDEQRNHPVWLYAAAVIDEAAGTGERVDIDEATRAFEAALRHQGWLGASG